MGAFTGEERGFAPDVCEFWQRGRVPGSPLYPKTRFLRWLHTDSEENYEHRGNKAFSVESVGYEFNGLGYRGPEFQTRPGEARVMFVGDSHTLGLGVPWEGLWTSLVASGLSERWGMPVRQCNLGWGATGADYVGMMVHQAVELLQPAAVFVLWSFVGRFSWFPDPRHQVHFIPEWMPDAYSADHAAYMRLTTQSQGFFNYVRNFHLVNARLAQLRVPFYWGNLEQFSPSILGIYLPLEGFVGRWTPIDLARDGRHAGLKSHRSFADLVLSKVDRDRLVPHGGPHETAR